jgi:signal transduction histidine kinase
VTARYGREPRLEADGRTFESFGPDPEKADTLGDASVNVIFEDSKGRLWVGTGGSGVERFDEAGSRFEHYGEEEGLAGSTVYGIVESKAGDLWISTSGGLTRFNPESRAFFTFGSEDGLASTELSQNSFLRTRDGRLWFGGPGGLTGFDPASLPAASQRPSIAITGIEIHGASPARRDSSGTLLLDWRNAGLSFRIAVLDYVAPNRNRYAMRIEGRQSAWTLLGHVNAGYIAPLPPGTYLLHAKGANGNGVWSSEGASLSIRVAPPFWDQAWFKVLVGLALAGAAVTLILARLYRLRARNALLVNFSRHIERAREDERTSAAREVHDAIGQHLVVLNIQTWWLAGHPEADAEARSEKVTEMQSVVGEAMAAVKRMATSLRPVALDALTFGETLRWYVRDFARRAEIEATSEVATGLPHFSDEAATALFRILQEALANVARHAGPCSVAVRISEEGGNVRLEVSDDGAGLADGAASAEDSFGIIGMRERCATLGGSLSMAGSPGKGTRLVAAIPALAARASNPDSLAGTEALLEGG